MRTLTRDERILVAHAFNAFGQRSEYRATADSLEAFRPAALLRALRSALDHVRDSDATLAARTRAILEALS